MKLTITQAEQITMLVAFTCSKAANGAERANILSLAKKVGLRDRLIEVHYAGVLQVKTDEFKEIEVELSKPELRLLITFLDAAPTQGTHSLFLSEFTERLQSELSRDG